MNDSSLIITVSGDIHANSVKWALQKQGMKTNIWVATDFPSAHTLSWFCNTNLKAQKDTKSRILLEDYKSVWLRRFWPSSAPKYLHPNDVSTATKEISIFRKSLLDIISPQALWVNSPGTLGRAGDKLRQLAIGNDIGFKIPPTLISNDIEDIQRFFIEQDRQVIYKPLSPMIWDAESSRHVTYTSKVSENDISNKKMLQACPGIFQKNITKAYEIRSTFIGKNEFSVRLETQGISNVEQDWRHAVSQREKLHCQPVLLPTDIREKCIALMSRLGILYGAFDFIVSPEDEYYFLEVNDGGQFLWVEQESPETPLIQVLSEFLISGDPNYTWSGKVNKNLSYKAYLKSEAYIAFHNDPYQGNLPYRYPTAKDTTQAAQ